jgi:hypothetical protein
MSDVFYVVVCSKCTPILPIPFGDSREMGEWVGAHVGATGHTVTVFKDERP